MVIVVRIFYITLSRHQTTHAIRDVQAGKNILQRFEGRYYGKVVRGIKTQGTYHPAFVVQYLLSLRENSYAGSAKANKSIESFFRSIHHRPASS